MKDMIIREAELNHLEFAISALEIRGVHKRLGTSQKGCLGIEDIQLFAEDKLEDERRRRVDSHIYGCLECYYLYLQCKKFLLMEKVGISEAEAEQGTEEEALEGSHEALQVLSQILNEVPPCFRTPISVVLHEIQPSLPLMDLGAKEKRRGKVEFNYVSIEASFPPDGGKYEILDPRSSELTEWFETVYSSQIFFYSCLFFSLQEEMNTLKPMTFPVGNNPIAVTLPKETYMVIVGFGPKKPDLDRVIGQIIRQETPNINRSDPIRWVFYIDTAQRTKRRWLQSHDDEKK